MYYTLSRYKSKDTLIMSLEQGDIKYNFDAINTLGAKPKLAYWVSKSSFRQNLIYAISLLLLLGPIGVLIYAYYFKITLMLQIGIFLTGVGLLQHIIVKDLLDSVKYIEHAENCRQKQVLGCQQIQVLNETIGSKDETIHQKRQQNSLLMEENGELKQQLDAHSMIAENRAKQTQQTPENIIEITNAVKKIIEQLPKVDGDVNPIIHALNNFSKTLDTHGHKIEITDQYYATFKGLLINISNLPENFGRYSELSEKTIKTLEKQNLCLYDIMQKIQHACMRAQQPTKPAVNVSPEFQEKNIILDIHHLASQSIQQLSSHNISQIDNDERKSLARTTVNTQTSKVQPASMFKVMGEYIGISPAKTASK